MGRRSADVALELVTNETSARLTPVARRELEVAVARPASGRCRADAGSGDTITLRAGASAARRTLTDDEVAFFAQEAGTQIAPRRCRENLVLERV